MPMHVMDSAPSGSKWKLTQFLDNFSIPEATLFADVLEVLCVGGGRGKEREGWTEGGREKAIVCECVFTCLRHVNLSGCG